MDVSKTNFTYCRTSYNYIIIVEINVINVVKEEVLEYINIRKKKQQKYLFFIFFFNTRNHIMRVTSKLGNKTFPLRVVVWNVFTVQILICFFLSSISPLITCHKIIKHMFETFLWLVVACNDIIIKDWAV